MGWALVSLRASLPTMLRILDHVDPVHEAENTVCVHAGPLPVIGPLGTVLPSSVRWACCLLMTVWVVVDRHRGLVGWVLLTCHRGWISCLIVQGPCVPIPHGLEPCWAPVDRVPGLPVHPAPQYSSVGQDFSTHPCFFQRLAYYPAEIDRVTPSRQVSCFECFLEADLQTLQFREEVFVCRFFLGWLGLCFEQSKFYQRVIYRCEYPHLYPRNGTMTYLLLNPRYHKFCFFKSHWFCHVLILSVEV